jgi:hypothetical protein
MATPEARTRAVRAPAFPGLASTVAVLPLRSLLVLSGSGRPADAAALSPAAEQLGPVAPFLAHEPALGPLGGSTGSARTAGLRGDGGRAARRTPISVVTSDGPHLPRRPSWRCRACAAAWPCRIAREILLTEYADDRVGLSVYLCTTLYDVTADLHPLQPVDRPTPRDLYRRFIGWVPR